jgi:hypothetical protein
MTFDEVLAVVKALTPDEKMRLLEALEEELVRADSDAFQTSHPDGYWRTWQDGSAEMAAALQRLLDEQKGAA